MKKYFFCNKRFERFLIKIFIVGGGYHKVFKYTSNQSKRGRNWNFGSPYSFCARGHYDDYFDYDGLYANAAANNEYDLSSSRFLITIIITTITIILPRKIDIIWNQEEVYNITSHVGSKRYGH